MINEIKVKCDNCGWEYTVVYDEEDVKDEKRRCACGGIMEVVDE